jgi:hypothetical protein
VVAYAPAHVLAAPAEEGMSLHSLQILYSMGSASLVSVSAEVTDTSFASLVFVTAEVTDTSFAFLIAEIVTASAEDIASFRTFASGFFVGKNTVNVAARVSVLDSRPAFVLIHSDPSLSVIDSQPVFVLAQFDTALSSVYDFRPASVLLHFDPGLSSVCDSAVHQHPANVAACAPIFASGQPWDFVPIVAKDPVPVYDRAFVLVPVIVRMTCDRAFVVCLEFLLLIVILTALDKVYSAKRPSFPKSPRSSPLNDDLASTANVGAR